MIFKLSTIVMILPKKKIYAEIRNYEEVYYLPIICSNRPAFLRAKLPRNDWSSDYLVCIKYYNPINIFCIFTMFKPVDDPSWFVDCRIPACKNNLVLKTSRLNTYTHPRIWKSVSLIAANQFYIVDNECYSFSWHLI